MPTEQDPNTRKNIYARPEAWREIEDAAKARYMSLSAYMVQAALNEARKGEEK